MWWWIKMADAGYCGEITQKIKDVFGDIIEVIVNDDKVKSGL